METWQVEREKKQQFQLDMFRFVIAAPRSREFARAQCFRNQAGLRGFMSAQFRPAEAVGAVATFVTVLLRAQLSGGTQ